MATPAINPYNKYQGNGSTVEFSIDFPYLDRSFIKVYVKRAGELQTVIPPADYSFSNDKTIRFPATGSQESVLAVGDVMTIQRETPVESDYEFTNQKRLFPEDVMNADDLSFQILQEQARELGRAIKTDPTSDTDPQELVNKVERIHDSLDNIDIVATHAGNVDTVAENISDVNTAAENVETIKSVAENEENINAAVANEDNINAAVANEENINTAVENMSAIQDAPQQAANAETSSEHSRIWAEGTDAEVQALGGEHSAKTYSQMISPIQYSSMPTPSITYLNRIIQYVGETTEDYTQGYFYKCVEDSSGGTTTYKWESILSGGGGSSNNLFNFIWSDYTLNDENWLQADTFSWQSGTVYSEAYNHLVADLVDATASIETVGSYSITVYTATDGHKIVLDDMEQTVINIFNESGIAWYYIVDTTNTRFKLPRSTYNKYSKNQILPVKGNGEPLGIWRTTPTTSTGTLQIGQGSNTVLSGNGIVSGAASPCGIETDQTKSGIEAVYNSVADSNMKLYFYVGEFSQSATEQTAGLNAELFNGKVDVDSLEECHVVVEAYNNGTDWYRLYSDGWVEQGGLTPSGADQSTQTVNLIKTMENSSYFVSAIQRDGPSGNYTNGLMILNYTENYFQIQYRTGGVTVCYWEVKGYAAQ